MADAGVCGLGRNIGRPDDAGGGSVLRTAEAQRGVGLERQSVAALVTSRARWATRVLVEQRVRRGEHVRHDGVRGGRESFVVPAHGVFEHDAGPSRRRPWRRRWDWSSPLGAGFNKRSGRPASTCARPTGCSGRGRGRRSANRRWHQAARERRIPTAALYEQDSTPNKKLGSTVPEVVWRRAEAVPGLSTGRRRARRSARPTRNRRPAVCSVFSARRSRDRLVPFG